MTGELDLYTKRIRIVNKRQKLKALAVKGLLVLLMVVVVVLIGLSSYSLILAQQNKILDSKIEATKKKIIELSDVESKQVYLLSKLGSFEELAKSQAKHQAVAETVFAILPQGTNLKGFQVADTGEIQLSGSVPDFPTFNELLGRIRKSQDYRLPIVKAMVSRVATSKEGNEVNFEISLTMAVKE